MLCLNQRIEDRLEDGRLAAEPRTDLPQALEFS
jgi:hypothetical protein